MSHETTELIGKKRKASQDEAELEINLDAPEPASKKALRKAKKSKINPQHDVDIAVDNEGASTNIPTSKTQNGVRSVCGIWIGNLAYTTTRSDLETFLTTDDSHVIKPEKISRINLPASAPKYGKPQNKGFAYVDFTDADTLRSALHLSEKLLQGRRVLIKDAKNFEGRPSSSTATIKETSDSVPNSRIFVGNLGFDTTVEDLESHFKVCGPVSNIHMATFEDSGKCKGYAWIEFDQLSSAQSAIRGWVEVGDPKSATDRARNSRRRVWVGKIKGRKLRMEYAEDRTTRYKKRFGKGAEGKDEIIEEGDVTKFTPREDLAFGSATGTGKTTEPTSRKQRPRESGSTGKRNREANHGTKKKQEGSSGYARETVERLRGAIMPGEGTKVIFD